MHDEGETLVSPEIRELTRDIGRRLRREHVRRVDRRRILEDIQGDLVVAEASGTQASDAIGADLDDFVAATLKAESLDVRRYDVVRATVGGALAGLAALVVGYLIVVLVLQPLFSGWFTLQGRYPTAGPVLVFVAVGLVGVAGVLVFLRFGMRGRPSVKRTVLYACVLVPLGAVAGTAVVLAIGAPEGPMSVGWIALAVLVISVPTVGAIAAARWWAVRTDASGRATVSGAD